MRKQHAWRRFTGVAVLGVSGLVVKSIGLQCWPCLLPHSVEGILLCTTVSLHMPWKVKARAAGFGIEATSTNGARDYLVTQSLMSTLLLCLGHDFGARVVCRSLAAGSDYIQIVT
eukprot:1920023-Amphidinium_carterae.1